MAEMEKDKMQEKSSGWKKWTAIAMVAIAGVFGGNVKEAEAAENKAEVEQPKAKVEAQVDQKAEFNQRIKVDLKANQARIQISEHVKPMEQSKTLENKLAALKQQQIQAARHRDQATVKAIQAEINKINAQIVQQKQQEDNVR